MSTVSIQVELCTVETERAILCLREDHEELWVPKSVIDEDSDVQGKGDSGTLVLAEWWAEKEGIE